MLYRGMGEERFSNIGDHLQRIEKNIELNTKDPVLRGGFTQVPNFILEDPSISLGGKIAYAMFLKYAWDNDCVFPGQKRLAEAMGVTQGRVSQFTKELNDAGLLEIKRRGLGRTNLYILNFTVKKSRLNRRRKNS